MSIFQSTPSYVAQTCRGGSQSGDTVGRIILSQSPYEQKSYEQVGCRIQNMDVVSIIARSKPVTGYSGRWGGGRGGRACLTLDFGHVGGEKA